jgi:hypothetical protein
MGGLFGGGGAAATPRTLDQQLALNAADDARRKRFHEDRDRRQRLTALGGGDSDDQGDDVGDAPGDTGPDGSDADDDSGSGVGA